ncbi:MAG: HAD family hydrolase [Planctomycetales bacterium]|nr:HAD family hydrolase [Planctomycetales bacterium]
MPNFRAIIFDLDDTLYAELDFVWSGFRAVARWLDVERGYSAEHTFAQLQSLFAESRTRVFDRWCGTFAEADGPTSVGLVRIYREHLPQIALAVDVQGMLRQSRSRYQLGLVTDGYWEVQRRKVDALGLTDALDAIVYSDEFGRDAWKPHTRPFEEVLDQLECPPEAAVYIGDNPLKDFLGARRAGMRSLRIRRHGQLHCQLEPASAEAAPDAEIHSFDELEQTLQRLTQLG